jgi:hypothetical protein
MGRALYIQSVEDAAAVAGGYERLAAALGVNLDVVKGWCAGNEIPECSVFLRVIEIIAGPAPRASGPAEVDERAASAPATPLPLS